MTLARIQDVSQRKGIIGSSDAATVLGVQRRRANGTPYDTRLQLFVRYTTGESARDYTMAMRRGHALEPVVLDLYSDREGLDLGDLIRAPTLVHAEHPWCVAHVDAMHGQLPYEGPMRRSAGRGVEVKTIGRFDDAWGADGTDQVPSYVVAQCVHASACSLYDAEPDTWWLPNWDVVAVESCDALTCWLAGDYADEVREDIQRNHMRVYPLELGKDLIDAALAVEREFHDTYLATNTPPPPIDASEAAMRWRYMLRGDRPLGWTRELQASAEALHIARQDVSNARALEDAAKTKLIGAMQTYVGEGLKMREVWNDEIRSADGNDWLCTFREDKNGKRTLRLNKKQVSGASAAGDEDE